jgi:predicted nucleotidyltransferase
MRLSSWQSNAIKEAARRVLGRPDRVWLFGSRADDTQRGGDIDLLFETDAALDNRAEAICRLYGALVMALGDRKIDVLLKDARTPDSPVFDTARREGVLL